MGWGLGLGSLLAGGAEGYTIGGHSPPDKPKAPGLGQSAQPRAPAAESIAPLPAVEAPDEYVPIIQNAASQHGISADVLARQLKAESGFDSRSISRAGALGIAQFLPETAKSLGVDPLDPNSAIPGAAKYDAHLLKRYGGNLTYALAAYNWGPGNVDKWIGHGADPAKLPLETKNYIGKILGDQTFASSASATSAATQGAEPLPQMQAGPEAAKAWHPIAAAKTFSRPVGLGHINVFPKASTTVPTSKVIPIPQAPPAQAPKYDYAHDPIIEMLNAQRQGWFVKLPS